MSEDKIDARLEASIINNKQQLEQSAKEAIDKLKQLNYEKDQSLKAILFDNTYTTELERIQAFQNEQNKNIASTNQETVLIPRLEIYLSIVFAAECAELIEKTRALIKDENILQVINNNEISNEAKIYILQGLLQESHGANLSKTNRDILTAIRHGSFNAHQGLTQETLYAYDDKLLKRQQTGISTTTSKAILNQIKKLPEPLKNSVLASLKLNKMANLLSTEDFEELINMKINPNSKVPPQELHASILVKINPKEGLMLQILRNTESLNHFKKMDQAIRKEFIQAINFSKLIKQEPRPSFVEIIQFMNLKFASGVEMTNATDCLNLAACIRNESGNDFKKLNEIPDENLQDILIGNDYNALHILMKHSKNIVPLINLMEKFTNKADLLIKPDKFGRSALLLTARDNQQDKDNFINLLDFTIEHLSVEQQEIIFIQMAIEDTIINLSQSAPDKKTLDKLEFKQQVLKNLQAMQNGTYPKLQGRSIQCDLGNDFDTKYKLGVKNVLDYQGQYTQNNIKDPVATSVMLKMIREASDNLYLLQKYGTGINLIRNIINDATCRKDYDQLTEAQKNFICEESLANLTQLSVDESLKFLQLRDDLLITSPIKDNNEASYLNQICILSAIKDNIEEQSKKASAIDWNNLNTEEQNQTDFHRQIKAKLNIMQQKFPNRTDYSELISNNISDKFKVDCDQAIVQLLGSLPQNKLQLMENNPGNTAAILQMLAAITKPEQIRYLLEKHFNNLHTKHFQDEANILLKDILNSPACYKEFDKLPVDAKKHIFRRALEPGNPITRQLSPTEKFIYLINVINISDKLSEKEFETFIELFSTKHWALVGSEKFPKIDWDFIKKTIRYQIKKYGYSTILDSIKDIKDLELKKYVSNNINLKEILDIPSSNMKYRIKLTYQGDINGGPVYVLRFMDSRIEIPLAVKEGTTLNSIYLGKRDGQQINHPIQLSEIDSSQEYLFPSQTNDIVFNVTTDGDKKRVPISIPALAKSVYMYPEYLMEYMQDKYYDKDINITDSDCIVLINSITPNAKSVDKNVIQYALTRHKYTKNELPFDHEALLDAVALLDKKFQADFFSRQLTTTTKENQEQTPLMLLAQTRPVNEDDMTTLMTLIGQLEDEHKEALFNQTHEGKTTAVMLMEAIDSIENPINKELLLEPIKYKYLKSTDKSTAADQITKLNLICTDFKKQMQEHIQRHSEQLFDYNKIKLQDIQTWINICDAESIDDLTDNHTQDKSNSEIIQEVIKLDNSGKAALKHYILVDSLQSTIIPSPSSTPAAQLSLFKDQFNEINDSTKDATYIGKHKNAFLSFLSTILNILKPHGFKERYMKSTGEEFLTNVDNNLKPSR